MHAAGGPVADEVEAEGLAVGASPVTDASSEPSANTSVVHRPGMRLEDLSNSDSLHVTCLSVRLQSSNEGPTAWGPRHECAALPSEG